jgi:hypothetical protein
MVTLAVSSSVDLISELECDSRVSHAEGFAKSTAAGSRPAAQVVLSLYVAQNL